MNIKFTFRIGMHSAYKNALICNCVLITVLISLSNGLKCEIFLIFRDEKMENVTKTLSLTLFSVLAIIFSNTASAVPCSDTTSGVFDNLTDLNSISMDCTDGTSANDKESILNAGTGFFNINTWVLLDKTDDLVDGGIGLTGGTAGDIAGDFSFNASVWDSYQDVIIVLKDGGSTIDKNIKWSAYLLMDGVSSGSWIFDGTKALSHLSVYANPVPVPAAVWLFASGLIGLVGVARKRS
jgi:hypothetical protein